MIVIIPTRRTISLEYLRPAVEAGARIIVVDDTPGTIDIRHPQVEVYNWSDKERVAGRFAGAFPGLNGSCMTFGFYLAWRDAGDEEPILTLGDDCRLDLPDFVSRMERALSARPLPLAKSSSRYINYLDLLENRPDNLFTRGFPYSDRIGYSPFDLGEIRTVKPSFNLGLFRNIQDINAIDKLKDINHEITDIALRCPSVVIPHGKLLSVSSGNMQFRRRMVPAVYQLPMHYEVAPNWIISRFGDIWGGFVLKRLMDKVGDVFTVGDPWVHHVLPGNVTANISAEHIGIMVNEAFIDLLDESLSDVKASDYLSMVEDLTEAFERRNDKRQKLLAPYIKHLTQSWRLWTGALRNH